MKKNIQARLNMNYAVLLTFQVNAALISKVPALAQLVEELTENVNDMEEAMVKLAGSNKGITDGKKLTRLELARQAAIYAGTLTAYATDQELYELKKKMNIAPAVWERMGSGKLLTFSRLVLQEMKINLAPLNAYGITADDVTKMETLITKLAGRIAAPKQARDEKNAVGNQLSELTTINRNLHNERLKKLMLQFRKTDILFYDSYIQSSKIRAPYTSHSRLQGIITDEATGKPLAGVEVKVPQTAYTTVTGRKGSYKLFIPEKGMYAVVFTKPGYKTEEKKEAEIITGEATVLSVALAAEVK